MIANAALGNLWVLPDFFQFIPGFPSAQDWVDAANYYLEGALRVSYRLAMPKFCPYTGETISEKFRCT